MASTRPAFDPGPHLKDGRVTIRVLRPWAKAITVVSDGQRVALEHERAGVFAGVLPLDVVPDYRLEVEYEDRTVHADDPYRFLPTLGELDLHLITEGRHERLWQVLGAHVRTYPTPEGDITGTSFAVWAPSAQGVRVVGDFNYWDGRAHPMRSLGSTGVWELFVPDTGDGTSTSTRSWAGRGLAAEGRPGCVRHRAPAGDSERRLHLSLPLARPGLDERARRA